jgi:hypothetical protein
LNHAAAGLLLERSIERQTENEHRLMDRGVDIRQDCSAWARRLQFTLVMKTLWCLLPLSLLVLHTLAACSSDPVNAGSQAAEDSGVDAARRADAGRSVAQPDEGDFDAARPARPLPLSVSSQSVWSASSAGPDWELHGVEIQLSNRAANCFVMPHEGDTNLTIRVMSATGDLPAGGYTITQLGAPALPVSAHYDARDEHCSAAPRHEAVAGTVVLSTISPTANGTYDLTFEDGARLTGAFGAPFCGDGPADLDKPGCP